MSDINRVVLSGRVGQDPEKKTAGSTELATLSIAVASWGGQDKGEQTTWVNLNLWGNRAKVAQYIRKGMKITVEGRLQIRKHEGKYYTAVNVDNLILPDRSRDEAPSQDRPAGNTDPDDDLPF
jgi:single stranded DNA-binding protein